MKSTGKLYVAATPIGNMSDASPRLKDVLSQADVVLAEDTRRAGMLCKLLGVEARKFVGFHEHNEERRMERVLSEIESGKVIALVSDAGTPLLSDPGYRLVRAARKAGLPVSPIPGPSAVTAALSASGLPPLPFVFLGFAPRKESEISAALSAFAEVSATLVFFERKNRVSATLAVASKVLGEREVCLARELTKGHEEFILGRLLGEGRAEVSLPDPLLGEVTVIIGPPASPVETDADSLLAILREELAAGGRMKEIAARVKARTTGYSAKSIYEALQQEKDESQQ